MPPIRTVSRRRRPVLDVHALRSRCQQLAMELDGVEDDYEDFGIHYHRLSINARERKVRAGLHFELSSRFCVLKAQGDQPAHTPQIILDLTIASGYHEHAKTALAINDNVFAERVLEALEEKVDSIREQLFPIDRLMEELSISSIEASQPISDDETLAAEARILQRNWLLSLPMTKRSLDIGVYSSEDEAWESSFGNSSDGTEGDDS